MTTDYSNLFREAMNLPPDARGALAAKLIDSLDSEEDSGAAQDWEQEISRRIAELESGEVETIPWSEVRKRLGRSS